MRLQHIEIENYGLFSGVEFGFHDGFQMIFGPNEAGKSTLLQLIREVLFGFPTRSPYAFASHSGEMAATAALQLADGTHIRYRRRKGRKSEVVGKLEPGGRDLDAAGLTRLLGGANLDLYQQVFGFALAELASGEQSLQQANLNEALYGGGLGGLANFQKVQADLKDEAESLFTTRGTTKTINRLLKRLKDTAAEQRKATVKPADYKKQVAACEELREQAEQLLQTLDAQQTRESHLQRIADALPPWLQLQAARQEWSGLAVPDGLAPDAAEQLARLKSRGEELADELATYEQDLEDNRRELTGIEWNPELLAAEEQIRSLNQQVGEIAGFRRDIPVREAESNSTKAQVLARLRELNPDWDHTQLERFRTSLDQRQTVERLEQQWDKLAQRRAELAVRQPALEDDIARYRERLAELAQAESPERFEALIEGEAAYKASLKSRQALTGDIERLTRETQKLQDKLNGPLQEPLDFTGRLPVPLEASVAEFQRRWDEAHDAVRQAQRELEQVQRDLRDRQQELDQLDARESVPDQQQLLQHRRRRDDGWRLIRRKFVDAEPVSDDELAEWTGSATQSVADEYQRTVTQADEVADERQAKAMAAAEHDQLDRAVERLTERAAQAQTALSTAERRAEEVQTEWAKLWQACPFAPLPPDAMRQWLGQYEELEDREQRLADARQGLTPLETEIDEFESLLQAEFPDSGESASQLLSRAKKAVRSARENEAKRATYAEDLPEKEKELKRIQKERQRLAEQEAEWQASWQAVLTEFGFPESWDVDVATRILTGLSEARSEYGTTASLDQRVRDMRAGVAEFEQAVADLCQRVAPDLAERPPEFAVDQLRQRLEAAKQSQQTQQRLTSEVEKLGKRVEAKQDQLEAARAGIQSLLAAANAESEPHFQQLAAAASRKAELERIVADASRELKIHRSTEPEEAFQSELEQADADSIASERRRLQEAIRTAKAARDKLLEEKALADRARQEMEAASEAAGLAMDLESARSELSAAVDRWAPLILAQTLMKRAIDKFEREHQPAMLGEVERLFRQLTLDRYVGIERKLDEHGTLLVVAQTGERKEPAALSTGTREQLYLAIRLAYIIHYCRDAEPLPIVMDDVLVNFDDDRAVQTLKVLQELAAQVQILFLTCHQHVVRLYQEIDGDNPVTTL